MTKKIFQLNPTAVAPMSLAGGTDELGFECNEFQDGQRRGVVVLRLRCRGKSVDIIPTRGMGIWQARNGSVRFGFNSPVNGPIHPRWVPISEPSGLGWLDGFNELTVRCGLTSNGAPEFDERGQLIHPLHGRIANLPAENVEVEIDEEKGRISATALVREHRFHFCSWQLATKISLQVDSPEIEISDQIINVSDRPGSFQMLYHNNFGPPVLEAGSRLYLPALKVAPRNAHAAKGIENWNSFGPPDPGYAEEVYFLELNADSRGETMALLTNSEESIGATIRYGTDQLRCFTFWKNTVGLADGYVTGLEPGTNYPNPRGFEEQHGRVVRTEPGQKVDLKLAIGMLIDRERISEAIKQIEMLAPEQPQLVRQPIPDWSIHE